MNYIIHNGDKDSIVISGETIEEVKSKSHEECLVKRRWKIEDCWSEKID